MSLTRRGDSGRAVTEISALLVRYGFLDAPTDEYDELVETAVRTFQQQQGLSVDGIVGPSTYRHLDESRWHLGDRVLTHLPGRLMSGDDVFELQQRLLDLGFRTGRVDGFFGPETEAGLRDFQRHTGIPPDGTCGPATLKAFARLRPLVSGGAPNAMRAQDRIKTAGPVLTGKVVVLDAMAPAVTDGDLRARGEAVVHDVVRRLEGRLMAIGVQAYLSGSPSDPYDEMSRAGFANQQAADLTLSLTVDSSPHPDACGISTYFFGSERHDTHSTTGERLAGLVLRELVARTGRPNLRSHAKTWDFLRATRMPAVRADLGYVTHRDDRGLLETAAYRDTVAEAILVAIQRFYLSADADARTGVMRFSELRDAVRRMPPP